MIYIYTYDDQPEQQFLLMLFRALKPFLLEGHLGALLYPNFPNL